MKEVLGKHKKLIISSACVIVSLIIIVIIAFFATASFAESSSIGKQNAENFAFVDAGIDPIEAKKLKTEFEFKNIFIKM